MKNENDFNPLSLDNQLCFALYVCSKEIIRKYQPLLEPLNLTYTMYITLLSLWECDNVTVKELGKKLFLDSGTLTPLLKKMESQNLIERKRSKEDERIVYIVLTETGKQLKDKCKDIPQKMACNSFIDLENIEPLLKNLHFMMKNFKENTNGISNN